MRVDLALKYLCLAKSRSSVKTLCDNKLLTINGRAAKPSATLHVDDMITLELASRELTIRLVDIPHKQLSKSIALSYYDVVTDR